MGKLSDVYSSVENPLENDEMIKKIIEAYSKSSRTDIFGSSDLYSSLVKMNQTKDSSQINLNDRETFMVETYNQWIENMLNLSNTNIQYLEKSKGIDAGKMQEYLRAFGKVSSMDDIEKLKNNQLFDKKINGWELQDGWEHFKSQYISGRTENKISVKHRLYVGCKNQDMWKLAKLFKNKCEQQQIPFYFKLGPSNERDDKMVIYADTDNLGNYISTLQEIAQEYPEIMERSGTPPALTGKIDGWIGIGDEPPKKENGQNRSYNSLRAEIFEDSLEETLLNELKEFKGKDVVFNGKQIKFNDLFMEQATQFLIEKLDKNKGKFNGKLPQLGLKEADLTSDRFKEYIKGHLRKKIQQGIEKLIDVKDQKSQLGGSNGQEIFAIPTREGKKIPIDTYDMDSIIKRMVPIMQQIDPAFIDKVKSQIQEKCRQNGIDDTFCFQQGSKEKFEQVDLAQPKKVSNEINLQQQQTFKMAKEETGTPSLKIDKSKNAMEISSADIVKILNPELLEQKIEMPNGAKIPARQYIQEIVAPYIPSNGEFILNNGSQISVKQYIEEFILGEGQKKYNGNISKLLSENTRGNNGTITVNGEQIVSKDIVKTLNPELMKRKVKLPNGVKISATQYIQEIVAPHIPNDGKFILKANGLGLPAKQFIEEAVMFEGQQKYAGDFKALLEDMTVANNGTISVETKIKAPRENGLQQEMGGQPKKQEEYSQHTKQIIHGNMVKSFGRNTQPATSEVNKTTSAIAERKNIQSLKNEKKRLIISCGNNPEKLSQENQKRLNEIAHQIALYNAQIANQQNNRKKRPNEMGMCR